MTHTPGPWDVTESSGDADVPNGCSIGIDDSFGADGGRDYFLATVVHGDPDELAANARLIAAAPDLLVSMAALLGCVNVRIDDRRTPIFDEARRVFVAAGGILGEYPDTPHV